MNKVIYSKYNRTRLPNFQVETSIIQAGKERFVLKKALCNDAINHIDEIYKINKRISHSSQIRGLSFPKILNNGAGYLQYEYIEGISFDRLLLNAFLSQDKEEFTRLLASYNDLLINSFSVTRNQNLSSIEDDVFGVLDLNLFKEQSLFLDVSCIDFIFDNIIIRDDKYYFIDNEWAFYVQLPLSFVFFRAVMEFYSKYEELGINKFLDLASLLQSYNILPDLTVKYHEMEQDFQNFVFGKNRQCDIKSRYLKGAKSFSDYDRIINEMDRKTEQLTEELARNTNWAKDLDKEVERHKDIYKGLTIELEDRTKWALKLEQEVESKNTNIVRLNEGLKEKENEVVQLNEGLKEKENEVVQLNEGLKEKETEVEALNLRFSQKNHELSSFRHELQVRDYEILALRKSYSFRLGRVFVAPVSFVIEVFRKAWFSFIILLNFFKHPINFIRKFSLSNVRRFFLVLKTESRSHVINNVRKFFSQSVVGFSPNQSKLQLFPVKNYNKKIVFEKVSSPLVSIIVPVYNQWNYTYSCFLSILENTKGISYEVILADDVSSDETKDINNYVNNIVVCRNEKNLGFLRNCKNAANHAKGQYLLFLNNDTNVQPGWLDSLLDIFNKDHKAGMVGSKLVYPDGRLQEAGGIIWKDGTGWNYGKLDDPEKPEYNYVKEVDYISGASIMIKTDLWKEIGGFDERYERAYFEDADLAFEVRKHGYKVIYQPKSVVVHFEGISCGTSEQSGEKSYQKKNREIFIRKWKLVLDKEKFANGENAFLARDRSEDKKTILVIDHYVPHFDKDAGSRSTFQYLKLFVDMGLNVKFIGDNFYKHEPYTTALEQLGIEVMYGDYYANNWKQWIKQCSQHINYVYLCRPHVAIKYIDFIKKNTGAKILYYGLDLHYLRETRRYEIEKDNKILKVIDMWKDMEFEILNKVDAAYYPSKTEVDILQSKFPMLKVYAIPVYIYENFQFSTTSDYSDRHGLLFVGSFNHLPNFDGLTWFIKEIFPKIISKHPEIKLYIVGANPPESLTKGKYKNIVICGYLSDEELVALYSKVRLVVVPLRYGAGMKGKVMEAMYRSVAVVSTSIGVEGIYGAEKMIKICDTANEFSSGVIDLYDDFGVMNEYVKKSLDYIESKFSVDAARKIIEKEINIKNE